MTDMKTETLKLSELAHWDARWGFFHVLLTGSDTFAALIIAKDAPLPMAHLDMSAHRQATALGSDLHRYLEDEVKAAIERNAHQVATGLSLMTHDEMKIL